MKKYANRGFTLIELLVVIAIIGILSSVVLASLSTARNKGKATSAVSSMSAMRSQAELGNSNGTYITNICTVSTATTPGGLDELLDAANAQAGAGNATCFSDETGHDEWGAQVDLTDVGGSGTSAWFCVDSTGFAGYKSASAVGTGDYACN